MIIAASVLYFDEKKYDEVLKLLEKYDNIETHQQDIENGKMVICYDDQERKII